MAALTAVLLVISLPIAVLGFLQLSQATSGVGLLALACYFAILARVAQAFATHGEIASLLDERLPKAAPESSPADSRAAPRPQTLGQPRQ